MNEKELKSAQTRAFTAAKGAQENAAQNLAGIIETAFDALARVRSGNVNVETASHIGQQAVWVASALARSGNSYATYCELTPRETHQPLPTLPMPSTLNYILKAPPTSLKELTDKLEVLVDATSTNDLTGPCTNKTDVVNTCLRRQHNAKRPGGYLAFDRSLMCEACLVHYLIDSARMVALNLEQVRKLTEAAKGT